MERDDFFKRDNQILDKEQFMNQLVGMDGKKLRDI